MEDVVCVKIRDQHKGVAFALTWGRTFDPVDSKELIEALGTGLTRLGFEQIQRIEVCDSLQSGAKERYFFEGLLSFAHAPIPFGRRYAAWAKSMQTAIKKGKGIFIISHAEASGMVNGSRKRRKTPQSKTWRNSDVP